MSTEKNAVPETPTLSHTEAAQARVLELRAMRQLIPHFVIPPDRLGRRRLSTPAAVPTQFIELVIVAASNHPGLVRGESPSASDTRELLTYADAYGPVADELEALAQFVRYSIAAAKARAGSEALLTYSVAQRLANRPEHADLVPHVADMRRVLRAHRRTTPAKAARTAEKVQQ